MQRTCRYEEMLPAEFYEAVKEMPVFLVPTGLLEWHADHLPLGQDSLKAHGICEAVARKLGGGIVLPPNHYGRPGYASFIGTLTFSEKCLTLLFTELLGELEKVGARVVLILTGHYGPCQVDFIKKVAADFQAEHPHMRIIAQPEYEGVTVNGESPEDHAGLWETSMFWYLHPELTHMDKFDPHPRPQCFYDSPPNGHYNESRDWKFGDPVLPGASRELGEKAVEIIAEHLAQKLRAALKELEE